MKRLLLIIFFVLTFTSAANALKPGLKVNTQAPDFTAKTYYGKTIKLSDYYKKGPVVLIFYRGGWCPYCNKQLREFQDNFKEISSLKASILAISVDKQGKAATTAQKEDLEFDVLTNSNADILSKYNLVYKVAPETAKMYKENYSIDLEAYSGRTDYLIAVPATYVIDKTGKIVFAYANEDYKVRVTPEEVIFVLRDL